MLYGKIYSTDLNNFEVSARYVGDGQFEDFKVVFKSPYHNKKSNKNIDPGETVTIFPFEKFKSPDENQITEELIDQAIEYSKP